LRYALANMSFDDQVLTSGIVGLSHWVSWKPAIPHPAGTLRIRNWTCLCLSFLDETSINDMILYHNRHYNISWRSHQAILPLITVDWGLLYQALTNSLSRPVWGESQTKREDGYTLVPR
jgi:hypothetical protein